MSDRDIDKHCKVVLSAIVPHRTDLLEQALYQLTLDHFQDKVLKVIFGLLERYASLTSGGILTRDALLDILKSRFDAGKTALYTETFQILLETKVLDSDFLWSLDQIKELAVEKSTEETIVTAMEIFRTGLEDAKGNMLKGHEDARSYVLERFSFIDHSAQANVAPEGNMRHEGTALSADYASRKASKAQGKLSGVLLGIPEIDRYTQGTQPGDLNLFAAMTGTGKSALVAQAAWSAVVEQGKNVVLFTTETLKDHMRRRIICRHSCLPDFGLREGLNSRDIKNASLSDHDEKIYEEVIGDFTTNPAYGNLQIAQMPRGATIASCEQRLYMYQKKFNVDYVIIDYLRLLSSSRKRNDQREELSLILIEAKELARTFDNGRGFPLNSPWQVSRAQWEVANRNGYYTHAALAETSEASNISDIIITLLAPSDSDSRYLELKAQILKNRDGETASGISVTVDYATSKFSSDKPNGYGLNMGSSSSSGYSTQLTGSSFDGAEYSTLL